MMNKHEIEALILLYDDFIKKFQYKLILGPNCEED